VIDDVFPYYSTGFTRADSWYIGGKPAITVTACSYAARTALLRRLLVMSVRVNGLASSWAGDDLAACATLPGLTSIFSPRRRKPQDLLDVDQALAGTSIGVQALIETPRVQNVDEITRAEERLRSVIIGYADLGAGLGRSRTAHPEHWLAVQDGSRKKRLRGDERHVIQRRRRHRLNRL
jgi:citrate lyase beta subunit